MNIQELNDALMISESRFRSIFESSPHSMQIKLEFSATGPVKIHCDPNRIDQVITNLMTNAIRYGKFKAIHVSLIAKDGLSVLKVKDHGIGIAKEDHERIFNRFERGQSSGDVAGLGLELFINHQIIEQHGGNIYVESKLDEGSTFIIELPCICDVARDV
ncbi:MAG TPA: HAMP domain-containing sensor histidine kinase [Bacteriovoracaceae bacterium]|nr:HAMP domain-containing sensor histidine kinase [Bacteriovoracaceae bacterium]